MIRKIYTATKHIRYSALLAGIVIWGTICMGGCAATIFKYEPPPSLLNEKAVLIDNDIYRQTLLLIKNAEYTLYIEQMILADPVILNEIIAKAERGVEIRILLDRWQHENEPVVDRLKNNNISVQYYPTEKGQYHRQKFIISDNKTVLFVSVPWSDSQSSLSALAFIMTGDTVQKAVDLFARDWHYTTTLELDTFYTPQETARELERVTLSSTIGMKHLILSHIESAQESIRIETQQINGDEEIINALISAQKRGCQVRILLDPACLETTPNTIKSLTEAQIECRYYNIPGKTLSRNFAIIDTSILINTSSAWTYNTFIINHEGALIIPSLAVTRKCTEVFELDWDQSR
ncbi:MAG: phospholipase D-like domain-containing protein [Peptococcaceae bacterium]|nr:phospholipase D-like domain-containing protein [Peptococcaceae bacterium]